MTRRVAPLLLIALSLCMLAGCGDDDALAPVDGGGADSAVDGGADSAVDGSSDSGADAGVEDAGERDASLEDAALCPDEDGDGHGAAPCGDDCDDTQPTVNADAPELCNAGVDDDCDGLVDAADGACVPCPSGYEGFDSECTDVDECASGEPCGAGVGSCVNMAGSYECACVVGYAAPPTGGTCTEVDECALATDDCDRDPGLCTNTVGSFTCACPGGFTGTARGAAGCLLTDSSLTSLVPSAGSLSPAFAGPTTLYSLTLPPGATSVTLTPTVAYPTHATITVNGVVTASGTASVPLALTGFAPVAVAVTVSTETGAMRAYTVVVSRGSTYAKASNTNANDFFGVALALSADAATLAVSAHTEASSATGVGGDQADNSAAQAGAVYVFVRAGSTWSQQAYLKASNTDAGDLFGKSLTLSADGSTLAVGATREASSATGIGGDQTDNGAALAGAVYVFTRAGSTWSQQAYLKASNTNAGDAFGYAVALDSSGSTLAVGAYNEDSSATGVGGNQADNFTTDSGAVYVFSRSGTTWSQQAYLKASNTSLSDWFGVALALSADGSTLAVDALGEDSSATGIDGNEADDSAADAGAIYVFTRSGSTWSQQAYLKASNTDAGDNFGYTLALCADGSTLAVGAWQEASNATGIGGDQANDGAVNAGAVYVFTRTGLTWSQQAYVKASNTGAGDAFGYAVALSADGATLAVGSFREGSSATGIGGSQADNLAPNAGAAYVFTRAGLVWSQQAYVKASNTGGNDRFGGAVALTGDGLTLAVGAYSEASSATGIDGDQASNTANQAGAVYIY